MPLRYAFAGFFFLTGLVLAVIYLVEGQPLAALALLLCGAIMGGVCLAGYRSLASESCKAVAGMAGIVGLAAVLSSSNLFRPQLQQGYAAVLPRFLEIDMYCPQPSPESRRVQEVGLAACALQNNTDTIEASSALQKGLQFGPGLTLVDSAAALTDDVKINHCARAFKEAERLCSLAFSSLPEKLRAALFAAAN